MEKRCLHILPMNKLSGAERLALSLCKNIKEYKPIVVCGGEDLKKIFNDNGITSYSVEFSNKKIISTLTSLKNIINENAIKIVHAHDNTASLNSYLAKRIFNLDIKIISHIHNCYPWLKDGGLNKKIDSILRPKYDHNITCGNLVYDYYTNNTNYFNKAKATSLSNAMDIQEIVKVDVNKSEEVISKFNIPKEKNIFGFIGRLDNQKGIIPFIQEFATQKEKFRDSMFLLVGNGQEEQKVKQLIKELEVEGFFILTGYQDEVYKFYPIIDIFFLPSRYEGLPMVILEAMAFKKPVVAMNVGSIGEVINKDTGILVAAGDYKEFVEKLEIIKSDKELMTKYSINGERFVREKYNILNYADNIVKLYDELA